VHGPSPQNSFKETLPITNAETVTNVDTLNPASDGIQDSPKSDFYRKRPFVIASILLPLLVAMLAVTTVGKFTTWRVLVFNICLAPLYFCIFIVTSLHMESWSHKFRKAKLIFSLPPFLAFSPFVIQCFRQITDYAFGWSVVIVVPLLVLYLSWCIICWLLSLLIKYSRQRRLARSKEGSEESIQSSTHPAETNDTIVQVKSG
jgi:hypothetical protein